MLCGYMLCMGGPSKIIYEKSSGQMYVYAILSTWKLVF
jgi:hypothetical protein